MHRPAWAHRSIRVSMHYSDQLCAAIDETGTPACVGIDPVMDRIPAGVPGTGALARLRAFCLGTVEAVAGVVPAVTPQSACYERYGAAGYAVLEELCALAKELGLLVVLDVKRGDIVSTASHYAAAAAGLGADAVTVIGYMGRSAIEPFLEPQRDGRAMGVYVLVRTSNPDSDETQSARMESGETVAERMASVVGELGSNRVGARGLTQVGAVVGATKSAGEVAELRERMPDAPVLVPGVGAQGGTIDQVRPLVRRGASSMGETGVLINASRSVIFPAVKSPEHTDDPRAWKGAIHEAAKAFASECSGVWSES